MAARFARWVWLGLALSIACADNESHGDSLEGGVSPAQTPSQVDSGMQLPPTGAGDSAGATPPGAADGMAGSVMARPDASTVGSGTGTTSGLAGGGGLSGGSLSGGGMMGGAEPDGGVTGPATPSGPNCLKGSGDFNAKGPYKVKQTNVTIGSQGPYTIFAPDPLEASCPHPIVAWGNGTGVSDSSTYGFYQEHAASWGIVVVASHNSNVGSGAFHKAGLDYLLQQNMMQGSPFYQKLSTRAGTSGHSQGGMGANQGASHPNVTTIVNVQGAFGTAPRGKNFLCLTGTADINPAGCKSSVDGASSPAFLANWQGGDHTGTATLLGFVSGDPGTKQYMRLYSAWFRCHLANDTQACAMFKGGMNCPICKDMGWAEIYAKNY